MSRSSYGNPPKGPNKGSAGTPNISKPEVSSVPNQIRKPGSTPDMNCSKGVHVTPIGAAKPAARTDQGRNTPKPGA